MFLQNFVLIQPRTSPPKICKIFEKCIFENCIFEICISGRGDLLLAQLVGFELPADLPRALELLLVEEHELPHEVVVVDVHSAREDDECNGNASAHNADKADIAVVFPALLLFSDASVVRHVDEHDALDVLGKPGGSVRGERANFTRLVLGCIDADFCK